MSESAALAGPPPPALPVVDIADRPYAPSWLHSLVASVERLPGPPWVTYAIVWVVATLLWHAQVWSTGSVAVGAFDPASAFWGYLAPALLWSATYFERVAAAAFDAFRPALTLPVDAAARLRYELVVVPARPAWVITVLAVGLTAADIALSGNPSYVGAPLPMLVLNFALQVIYVSVMFQLVYRLGRQMGLVRRTLATSVVIDTFRPGPLNAFAMLTSRPGAILTLLTASSLLLVPAPSDTAGALLSWAPYVVAPPIIAAIAFVVPLTGAHAALVGQKEQLQDEAEARIQGILADINRDVDARDLGRADELNKTLSSLLIQRDILAKLPTWPWSIGTLRSFVSAILLPMTLFLLQQALSRLL